jgi:UDP-glucose:(heptosyl)LPS alpha-1,3-glucosyltransferase
MKKLYFIKKRFSLYGGAENYMKTLVNQLKHNYEITILSAKWEAADGIQFRNVPCSNMTSLLSLTTFNRNACDAVRNSAPDCTISFERTTCQDIYRAGEGCHAEWLAIRSELEPFYKKISFRVNPLHQSLLNIEKELFARTASIVANSRMVKANIIKHYAVPEEKIHLLYNGVDLGRFSPDNKEKWREKVRTGLALRQDEKLLLFLGSGFRRKGLRVLLEAVPLTRNKAIRVMVIGKDRSHEFRSLAARHGVVDRIFFMGPQTEVEQYYAAADLFVLPTIYDPFSNATLEAMASGIPVITTRNNGAAELIENGKEGFVVGDMTDPMELAARINDALDEVHLMGDAARRRAAGFDIEKTARAFAEIIDSSVGHGAFSGQPGPGEQ